MQEESGSHEAVEADQREQIKAEVPRCMHEDVLKSRGALHIQDGPGSSAWEWVRVRAGQEASGILGRDAGLLQCRGSPR